MPKPEEANLTYWDKQLNEEVERPDVDAFIQDIILICEKHNMSISHEDGHGSFIIETYHIENIKWLSVASIDFLLPS